jgi:hypothetical protein
MKWLFAVLLALALAGCAESGNFDQEKPIKLAVPIEPILPPTKPVPRKSQLARAEASETEANDSTSNIDECARSLQAPMFFGVSKGSRQKKQYFKIQRQTHLR